ncbi:hypothetical protein CB1_000265012 [Camelus ferus]|nr:hypothetical protein CB1_000265012 [Camelus ferus]
MLVRPDGFQFSLLRVTEEALHTWTATQIRAGLKSLEAKSQYLRPPVTLLLCCLTGSGVGKLCSPCAHAQVQKP